MVVNCPSVIVDIEVTENGVYPFLNYSGSGKTFLMKEISKLRRDDFNILVFSELDDDSVMKLKISNFLSRKAKYCLIDR